VEVGGEEVIRWRLSEHAVKPGAGFREVDKSGKVDEIGLVFYFYIGMNEGITVGELFEFEVVAAVSPNTMTWMR
jgi:hypothetical protein